MRRRRRRRIKRIYFYSIFLVKNYGLIIIKIKEILLEDLYRMILLLNVRIISINIFKEIKIDCVNKINLYLFE
jgi:hypothetical protein